MHGGPLGRRGVRASHPQEIRFTSLRKYAKIFMHLRLTVLLPVRWQYKTKKQKHSFGRASFEMKAILLSLQLSVSDPDLEFKSFAHRYESLRNFNLLLASFPRAMVLLVRHIFENLLVDLLVAVKVQQFTLGGFLQPNCDNTLCASSTDIDFGSLLVENLTKKSIYLARNFARRAIHWKATSAGGAFGERINIRIACLDARAHVIPVNKTL